MENQLSSDSGGGDADPTSLGAQRLRSKQLMKEFRGEGISYPRGATDADNYLPPSAPARKEPRRRHSGRARGRR